jgi:hypothetical protein
MIFAANSSCRLKFACDSILPKLALPYVVFGAENTGWFGTLNRVNRNCKRAPFGEVEIVLESADGRAHVAIVEPVQVNIGEAAPGCWLDYDVS